MEHVQCEQGVYDCAYDGLAGAGVSECSDYNNHYPQMQGDLWVVVLAALVMGAMGLAIGGNDVANAWGTSVGSGAITVQRALAVAAISNVLGATLLGSGVADKLQKGVSAVDDPECFSCGFCDSKMTLYSLGMLSALFAAASFLFLATYKKLPVSTTHAIVGGIVGITIGANRNINEGVAGVLHGSQCVDWGLSGFGGMVMSWVLSPVLAGGLACLLYAVTFRMIHNVSLSSPDARSKDFVESPDATSAAVSRTLRLLPLCYSGMTWTMVFLICSKSSVTQGMPLSSVLAVATGLAVVAFLIVNFGLVPHIAEQLVVRQQQTLSVTTTPTMTLDSSTNSNMSAGMDRSFNPLVGGTAGENSDESNRGKHQGKGSSVSMTDVNFCFQNLLICVAALESFAHGANDTANATAAFSAVIMVYEDGLNVCASGLNTPVWVMATGGGFVAAGVLLFGRGVITTIGEKLTALLDCHKGFCIEFSSCAAVVMASAMGLPVSTTHCQVGAVVAIGIQSTGVGSVDWQMVRDIVTSWVLTVPFSALLAAGILNLLKLTLVI